MYLLYSSSFAYSSPPAALLLPPPPLPILRQVAGRRGLLRSYRSASRAATRRDFRAPVRWALPLPLCTQGSSRRWGELTRDYSPAQPPKAEVSSPVEELGNDRLLGGHAAQASTHRRLAPVGSPSDRLARLNRPLPFSSASSCASYLSVSIFYTSITRSTSATFFQRPLAHRRVWHRSRRSRVGRRIPHLSSRRQLSSEAEPARIRWRHHLLRAATRSSAYAAPSSSASSDPAPSSTGISRLDRSHGSLSHLSFRYRHCDWKQGCFPGDGSH